MILTKEVSFIVRPIHLKHLKNLGYKNLKVGSEIVVIIKHLTKGSDIKIKVKCDVCGKEKMLSYVKYNKNINNQNYYSCSSKCSRKKTKNTNINIFGVENPFQSEGIKEKIRKTNLEKYGVGSPSKNKGIQNKIKQTNLSRYGVENPQQNKNIKDKTKQTNLEKYGVEYALQNKDIQKKIKQTNLEKYGVEYAMQNEDVKNKRKKTNLEKYGVEFVSQNKKIQRKIKQTMLKKYGVENPTQNKEIYKKQQKKALSRKKYKNTSLYYQGTYEKHFLDFCFENNIVVENGPSVKFLFENKNKIYYSDFYLKEKNLIIEIKSDYYYKKYLEKNFVKQKSCIEQGYNFIFIIDKDYTIFNNVT